MDKSYSFSHMAFSFPLLVMDITTDTTFQSRFRPVPNYAALTGTKWCFSFALNDNVVNREVNCRLRFHSLMSANVVIDLQRRPFTFHLS